MIPDSAIEAAAGVIALGEMEGTHYLKVARLAIEAAAPHLLSHERQQTADAHRDAMVNRETSQALLAEAWDEGIRAGIRCDGGHNPYRHIV